MGILTTTRCILDRSVQICGPYLEWIALFYVRSSRIAGSFAIAQCKTTAWANTHLLDISLCSQCVPAMFPPQPFLRRLERCAKRCKQSQSPKSLMDVSHRYYYNINVCCMHAISHHRESCDCGGDPLYTNEKKSISACCVLHKHKSAQKRPSHVATQSNRNGALRLCVVRIWSRYSSDNGNDLYVCVRSCYM